MENMLFSPIPLIDFENLLRKIVREEIDLKTSELPERLLSATETCKLFSISRTTLHSWTIKGLLPKQSISGRVYYKHSEVLQSLNSLKRYKHN